MAKLKNVTQSELDALAEQAMDVSQLAADVHRRADQGYIDEVQSPIQKAAGFMAASAILADVARTLILKASLQEQKREIEARLRDR